MGRKTFKVEDFKDKVNGILLHTPDRSLEAREQSMALLESVLHETGNYSGFGYLDVDDMVGSDNGNTVGINDTVSKKLPYDERFADTDRTRVKYF